MYNKFVAMMSFQAVRKFYMAAFLNFKSYIFEIYVASYCIML